MGIEEFWNDCHKYQKKDYLSGCSFDETIDFLKIREFIKPSLNVLEIGVGCGYVVQGLNEFGVNVYALDISKIALNNVKHLCKEVYHIDEIKKLEKDFFDLIICHNVIQHIPTPDLIEEFRYIMPSLKKDGLFAFEFVSDDVHYDSWKETFKFNKNLPSFCRSPELMKTLLLLLKSKGEVVVSNSCDFPKVKMCHVIHARKI